MPVEKNNKKISLAKQFSITTHNYYNFRNDAHIHRSYNVLFVVKRVKTLNFTFKEYVSEHSRPNPVYPRGVSMQNTSAA